MSVLFEVLFDGLPSPSTALESATPNQGSGAFAKVATFTNTLRKDGTSADSSTYVYYGYFLAAATANCSGQIVVGGNGGASVEVGADFRMQADGVEMYALRINSSGTLSLYHINASGTLTTPASAAGFLSAGWGIKSYQLDYAMVGNVCTVTLTNTTDSITYGPVSLTDAGNLTPGAGKVRVVGKGLNHTRWYATDSAVSSSGTLGGDAALGNGSASGGFEVLPPSTMSGDANLGAMSASGGLGLAPGIATVAELRNWSNMLLTSQTVANVAVLRIARPVVLLDVLYDLVTHASSADLVVSSSQLVPGMQVMVLGFNLDGSLRLARPVTVV